MKEIVNTGNFKEKGKVTYLSPEIQIYEIGIEKSILQVSGGEPPFMGYDGDGWL